MADCAMIYDWHTRTHRKEKETEYYSELLRVLLCTVLLLFFFVVVFLFCFFTIWTKVHRGLSVTVLDSSRLEWGCVTLWTGKWAADTGEEYFCN